MSVSLRKSVCPACHGARRFTSLSREFTYNCGTCNGTGLDRRPVLEELTRLGWKVFS
jgi:hypothetical protein